MISTNECRHFGHLEHTDKAANEVSDFIKAVAAHGVCYGLTVKKQMPCNCLAKLSSQMDDGPSSTDFVVAELVGFAWQDKEQQQKQVFYS